MGHVYWLRTNAFTRSVPFCGGGRVELLLPCQSLFPLTLHSSLIVRMVLCMVVKKEKKYIYSLLGVPSTSYGFFYYEIFLRMLYGFHICTFSCF